MEKFESIKKSDKIKNNLLSKRKILLKKNNLVPISNNVNNYKKMNLVKSPLLYQKMNNIGNFQKYISNFKTLKKNNSQIFNIRNKLPLLNNNHVNNISTNKKNKLSLISNNLSADLFLSQYSIDSKPVKDLKKKPIKIQFFSKLQSIEGNKHSNNSIILKGLLSPKYSQIRNKKSLIKNESNSLSKEIHSEELNNSNDLNDNNITSNENVHIKKRNNHKFQPFRFSNFYKLSKNSDISAKSIYKHYLLEEIEDNMPDPINNFIKYVLKKYKNPQQKLEKLYCINDENIRRIKELKNNNSLVLKDDFNLKEYQNILCGMIKKRCHNDSIIFLKKQYEKFNDDLKYPKRNYKYRGRYTKLADKIRKIAPIYLINRLKQLDKENLISKAKYFNVDLSKCGESF